MTGFGAQSAARRIVEESARTLDTPEHQLRVSAIQSEFPWIKRGEVLWVRRVDFEALIYWVRSNQTSTVLNRGNTLDSISSLLRDNVGPLPGTLTAPALAAALRKLTVEPRGYVMTPQFFERVKPNLSDWTRGDTELALLLQSHSIEPTLRLVDQTGWQLEFRYINPQGGIELWHASGDRDFVRTLQKSLPVAEGTFRFPVR